MSRSKQQQGPVVRRRGQVQATTTDQRLLESHGGAVVITEADATGDGLYNAVAGILSDSERRRAMADAMGQLGIPDATARIYDTVTALVRK